MFECIYHQLMEWYAQCCQIDTHNLPQEQIVISKVTKRIRDLTAWQAQWYHLIPNSETIYEVFSLEKSSAYTVNLDFMTCTYFQ